MPGQPDFKLNPALFRLLQLCSPALPVGSFAYSRGLEWAVHAGWVSDEPSARSWILGLAGSSLARLDVPLLARLCAAFHDNDSQLAFALCARLYAYRETSEARLEERQSGQALARLLIELGFKRAEPWLRYPRACFAALFALAGEFFAIKAQDVCAGYVFVWCESQVAAAVKLVPLGQSAGQRILLQAGETLLQALQCGLELGDEEIGALAPGQALACGLHESMRTRLFRS